VLWLVSKVLFAVAVFVGARLLIPFLTGAAKRKRLKEQGVAARATITSLQQTGKSINDQPQCRIGVRVEPEGGAPFDAVATQVVLLTQIPQFQPGQAVNVWYDPAQPSEVAIEPPGAMGGWQG